LTSTRQPCTTRFAFTTDAPSAVLVDPGSALSGTVKLVARARAIAGRRVASVSFQYSEAGADSWTDIGMATTQPFAVAFDTTKVADGVYDLRAVVTDNTGSAALSPAVRRRMIQNGNAQ